MAKRKARKTRGRKTTRRRKTTAKKPRKAPARKKARRKKAAAKKSPRKRRAAGARKKTRKAPARKKAKKAPAGKKRGAVRKQQGRVSEPRSGKQSVRMDELRTRVYRELAALSEMGKSGRQGYHLILVVTAKKSGSLSYKLVVERTR